MKISPIVPNFLKNLPGYLISFQYACQQALYAICCLKEYSDHENSNITEFFVAYYLDDFIIRVKTATDLLALIINQQYGLLLNDKKCSLENGEFCGNLRKSKINSRVVQSLATEIDRIRNGWLETFDKLRDLVIHQAGLTFVSVGGVDYPIHILLPIPNDMLNQPIPYFPDDPLKPFMPYIHDEILLSFLVQIKTKSISQYFSINPVIFCEEVWELLRKAADNILTICKDDLLSALNIHEHVQS